MVEQVKYKGVTYRRYEGRRYFEPGMSVIRKGGTSLHRQKWIDKHGPIPPDYHVHHRDGDCSNNRIGNLKAIHKADHGRLHIAGNAGRALGLEKYQASEKGKSQLRRNAKAMVANSPVRQFECVECGEPVTTKHPTQKYCKACSKRMAAKGFHTRPCAICGVEYRYKPHSTREVRTCSVKCGWELRRRNASPALRRISAI